MLYTSSINKFYNVSAVAKQNKMPQATKKSTSLQCLCCRETKQNVTSNHKHLPQYDVSAIATEKMPQTTEKSSLLQCFCSCNALTILYAQFWSTLRRFAANAPQHFRAATKNKPSRFFRNITANIHNASSPLPARSHLLQSTSPLGIGSSSPPKLS